VNRSAILFIDFQRDFFAADGRLSVGAARAEAILTQAGHLLSALRAGRYEAVFIVNEFSPEDWLGNFLRNHSALRGSRGAEIDPRIMAEGFPVFTKSAADAFSNPQLLAHLRQREIGELALAGVMAEACVRATAKSALRHGFRVTLLADAVESRHEWKKRAAFWYLRRKGVTIQTCAEFLETT